MRRFAERCTFQHAGRGINLILAQFKYLETVVAWICTQACNEKLRGDILRCRVMALFSDLPVVRSSSVVDHFNDMKRSICGRGSQFYDLLFAEVFPITTQAKDLMMVDAC